ncbi:hypothetical protein [Dongia sp. agr-C8]
MLNGFKVLAPGLIEVDSYRGGIDTAIILRVEVRGSSAEVNRSWALEDLLEELLLSPIVGVYNWPRLAPDGSLSFTLVKRHEGSVVKDIQSCMVNNLDSGEPNARCESETSVVDVEAMQHPERTRCGTCYGAGTSPSGRWSAWMKEVAIDNDNDVGTVELYLAPTADLLKP